MLSDTIPKMSKKLCEFGVTLLNNEHVNFVFVLYTLSLHNTKIIAAWQQMMFKTEQFNRKQL